jgi:hypothetical protein
MQNDKLSLYLREVLAFSLKLHTSLESPKEVLSSWYSDPDFRKNAREKADNLLQMLEDSGVKLRKANSNKLNEAIDTMRTIPSQTAYTDDELK